MRSLNIIILSLSLSSQQCFGAEFDDEFYMRVWEDIDTILRPELEIFFEEGLIRQNIGHTYVLSKYMIYNICIYSLHIHNVITSQIYIQ